MTALFERPDCVVSADGSVKTSGFFVGKAG